MSEAEIDLEWHAFRAWLEKQPRSTNMIEGYRTWRAIDESQRTGCRITTSRSAPAPFKYPDEEGGGE